MNKPTSTTNKTTVPKKDIPRFFEFPKYDTINLTKIHSVIKSIDTFSSLSQIARDTETFDSCLETVHKFTDLYLIVSDPNPKLTKNNDDILNEAMKDKGRTPKQCTCPRFHSLSSRPDVFIFEQERNHTLLTPPRIPEQYETEFLDLIADPKSLADITLTASSIIKYINLLKLSKITPHVHKKDSPGLEMIYLFKKLLLKIFFHWQILVSNYYFGGSDIAELYYRSFLHAFQLGSLFDDIKTTMKIQSKFPLQASPAPIIPLDLLTDKMSNSTFAPYTNYSRGEMYPAQDTYPHADVFRKPFKLKFLNPYDPTSIEIQKANFIKQNIPITEQEKRDCIDNDIRLTGSARFNRPIHCLALPLRNTIAMLRQSQSNILQNVLELALFDKLNGYGFVFHPNYFGCPNSVDTSDSLQSVAHIYDIPLKSINNSSSKTKIISPDSKSDANLTPFQIKTCDLLIKYPIHYSRLPRTKHSKEILPGELPPFAIFQLAAIYETLMASIWYCFRKWIKKQSMSIYNVVITKLFPTFLTTPNLPHRITDIILKAWSNCRDYAATGPSSGLFPVHVLTDRLNQLVTWPILPEAPYASLLTGFGSKSLFRLLTVTLKFITTIRLYESSCQKKKLGQGITRKNDDIKAKEGKILSEILAKNDLQGLITLASLLIRIILYLLWFTNRVEECHFRIVNCCELAETDSKYGNQLYVVQNIQVTDRENGLEEIYSKYYNYPQMFSNFSTNNIDNISPNQSIVTLTNITTLPFGIQNQLFHVHVLQRMTKLLRIFSLSNPSEPASSYFSNFFNFSKVPYDKIQSPYTIKSLFYTNQPNSEYINDDNNIVHPPLLLSPNLFSLAISVLLCDHRDKNLRNPIEKGIKSLFHHGQNINWLYSPIFLLQMQTLTNLQTNTKEMSFQRKFVYRALKNVLSVSNYSMIYDILSQSQVLPILNHQFSIISPPRYSTSSTKSVQHDGILSSIEESRYQTPWKMFDLVFEYLGSSWLGIQDWWKSATIYPSIIPNPLLLWNNMNKNSEFPLLGLQFLPLPTFSTLLPYFALHYNFGQLFYQYLISRYLRPSNILSSQISETLLNVFYFIEHWAVTLVGQVIFVNDIYTHSRTFWDKSPLSQTIFQNSIENDYTTFKPSSSSSEPNDRPSSSSSELPNDRFELPNPIPWTKTKFISKIDQSKYKSDSPGSVVHTLPMGDHLMYRHLPPVILQASYSLFIESLLGIIHGCCYISSISLPETKGNVDWPNDTKITTGNGKHIKHPLIFGTYYNRWKQGTQPTTTAAAAAAAAAATTTTTTTTTAAATTIKPNKKVIPTKSKSKPNEKEKKNLIPKKINPIVAALEHCIEVLIDLLLIPGANDVINSLYLADIQINRPQKYNKDGSLEPLEYNKDESLKPLTNLSPQAQEMQSKLNLLTKFHNFARQSKPNLLTEFHKHSKIMSTKESRFECLKYYRPCSEDFVDLATYPWSYPTPDELYAPGIKKELPPNDWFVDQLNKKGLMHLLKIWDVNNNIWQWLLNPSTYCIHKKFLKKCIKKSWILKISNLHSPNTPEEEEEEEGIIKQYLDEIRAVRCLVIANQLPSRHTLLRSAISPSPYSWTGIDLLDHEENCSAYAIRQNNMAISSSVFLPQLTKLSEDTMKERLEKGYKDDDDHPYIDHYDTSKQAKQANPDETEKNLPIPFTSPDEINAKNYHTAFFQSFASFTDYEKRTLKSGSVPFLALKEILQCYIPTHYRTEPYYQDEGVQKHEEAMIENNNQNRQQQQQQQQYSPQRFQNQPPYPLPYQSPLTSIPFTPATPPILQNYILYATEGNIHASIDHSRINQIQIPIYGHLPFWYKNFNFSQLDIIYDAFSFNRLIDNSIISQFSQNLTNSCGAIDIIDRVITYPYPTFSTPRFDYGHPSRMTSNLSSLLRLNHQNRLRSPDLLSQLHYPPVVKQTSSTFLSPSPPPPPPPPPPTHDPIYPQLIEISERQQYNVSPLPEIPGLLSEYDILFYNNTIFEKEKKNHNYSTTPIEKQMVFNRLSYFIPPFAVDGISNSQPMHNLPIYVPPLQDLPSYRSMDRSKLPPSSKSQTSSSPNHHEIPTTPVTNPTQVLPPNHLFYMLGGSRHISQMANDPTGLLTKQLNFPALFREINHSLPAQLMQENAQALLSLQTHYSTRESTDSNIMQPIKDYITRGFDATTCAATEMIRNYTFHKNRPEILQMINNIDNYDNLNPEITIIDINSFLIGHFTANPPTKSQITKIKKDPNSLITAVSNNVSSQLSKLHNLVGGMTRLVGNENSDPKITVDPRDIRESMLPVLSQIDSLVSRRFGTIDFSSLEAFLSYRFPDSRQPVLMETRGIIDNITTNTTATTTSHGRKGVGSTSSSTSSSSSSSSGSGSAGGSSIYFDLADSVAIHNPLSERSDHQNPCTIELIFDLNSHSFIVTRSQIPDYLMGKSKFITSEDIIQAPIIKISELFKYFYTLLGQRHALREVAIKNNIPIQRAKSRFFRRPYTICGQPLFTNNPSYGVLIPENIFSPLCLTLIHLNAPSNDNIKHYRSMQYSNYLLSHQTFPLAHVYGPIGVPFEISFNEGLRRPPRSIGLLRFRPTLQHTKHTDSGHSDGDNSDLWEYLTASEEDDEGENGTWYLRNGANFNHCHNHSHDEEGEEMQCPFQ